MAESLGPKAEEVAPAPVRRVQVGRWIIAVALVAAMIVGVLALVGTWSSDTSPARSTVRHRLDLLERDRYILALMNTPHSAQTTMESLSCQPVGDSRKSWNFRVLVIGTDRTDQLGDLLENGAAYGWRASYAPYPSAGPGPQGGAGAVHSAFSKSIEVGLTIELFLARYDGVLELDANLSAGLSC